MIPRLFGITLGFKLGLSLLLAGCALNPKTQLSPDTLQQIPPRAEITATPFILQQDYQCGPASLAMVMNLYGKDVSPTQLAAQVFTPKAEGSFPVEMDIASRRQGFISYPLNSLDALLQEIAAGHPVLIQQNLGVSWYPKWHFAVVVGYDLAREELVLRSGDLPRRQTAFTLFDTTWQRSQRWARVILPPDQLPATAQPLDYVQAVTRLEQAGQFDAARRAYESALLRWPQDALARFGLANLLLTQQQPGQAIEQYIQLLTRHPTLAQGWNNYAYALRANGCRTQALQAAQCGGRLAPDNKALLETIAEMAEPGLPTSAGTSSANPLPVEPASCPVLTCPKPAM